MRKLRTKNFPSALIETVLNSLAQEGLFSDQRFTEAYISMRSQRGYGPLRIQAELRERGISDDMMAANLNAYDEIWQINLQKLAKKKYIKGLAKDRLTRAKQIRFLQYRGFSFEHIQQLDK